MVTSVERLAQEIEYLRRKVNAAARTPQLPNSSIDDGALTLVTGGQVSGTVGTQYDGTTGAVVVAGPNPPIPDGLTAETVIGGILVHWDGSFEDPQTGFTSPVVAPLDYLRIDIEVSNNVSFPVVGFGPVHGSIHSASGGDMFIAWATPGEGLYVRLRTRTLPGKLSSPSQIVGPVTAGQVNLGDLGFDITDYAGGNTIYYGASTPTAPPLGFTAGDLWLQSTGTTGPSGQPNYLTYRWNGSAWVLLQDQGISQSLANALAAQTTANSAVSLANAAQTTANGKIVVFYQGTAPASGMSTGDLWVNTALGNALNRWNGTSWVAIQDAGISSALSAAATAQTTANSKILVFAQDTAPTASELGDIWIETDNGNKESVWGPIPTVQRTNYAVNPSMEYDATGSIVNPSGWADATGGTTGTITTTIVGSGATFGTKVAKIVGAGLTTLNTGWIGFSQIVPCAPGDLLYLQSWLTYAVTSASQRPEYLIDWLNAAGGTISSTTDTTATTMGTAGSRAPYSFTSGAAPALTANARVTLRRRGTLSSGGTTVTNADLTLDAMIIERNRAAGAPTGYFDGSTSGTDFIWNGLANLSTSTAWQAGTSGSNAWQPVLLRTGAFQPQSILAANVIATGSVVAALLEANMVLATSIFAGPLTGDHSSMTPDGFHVYRTITGEGLQEVGRLGSASTAGFLAFVDSTGTMVANIDDTGGGNFTDLNIDNDPSFQGESLTVSLNRASGSGGPNTSNPGATHWYGYADGTVTNVDSNEIGLIEVPSTLDANRMYMVWGEICWHPQGIPCSLFMRIRDGGASAPLMTSQIVHYRQHTGVTTNYDSVSQSGGLWQPTTTGQHRLLLTAQAYASGAGLAVTDVSGQPAIVVQDLGPARALNATINHATGSGGGSAPAPTQQYYVELSPVSTVSRRGDGSLRSDTTDVVQGWDPSGFNGDGYGYWGFTLPSITGTVDRVDFYVYCNHTYFGSGGSAIINILHSGTDNPESSFELMKLQSDAIFGGYPNPGPKAVTLSSSWYSKFLSSASPRAGWVSVGNSDGTNEQYYCRFTGNSARLRIWYTQ